jgi:hypothetical protein
MEKTQLVHSPVNTAGDIAWSERRGGRQRDHTEKRSNGATEDPILVISVSLFLCVIPLPPSPSVVSMRTIRLDSHHMRA